MEGVSTKCEDGEEDLRKENHWGDEDLREWTEVTGVKQDLKYEIEQEIIHKPISETEDSLGEKNGNSELQAGQVLSKTYNKELDRTLEKLCRSAPVSENFASLCSYKCPRCNKVLYSWNSLHLHFKVGSDCHRKLLMTNVAHYVQKVVCHTCKVCSANLLCDSVFLKRHIHLKHQMLPKEYIREFALDVSQRTCAEQAYSNNFIGNLCLFQCDACERRFETRIYLNGHKKLSCHRSKSTLVKEVYHKCKLCNKTVLCEIPGIQEHLKRVHDISLQEYCKNNDCVLDESFFTLTALRSNTKISKDSDQSIARLCEDVPVSKRVAFMCRFCCPKCGKELKTWNMVVKHSSKNPDCGMKISKRNIANLITKTVAHKCNICMTKTLCDSHYILKHLRKRHNMSLKQYIKEFGIDSSKLTTVGVYSENIIGNLSLYQCDDCEKQFVSLEGLNSHKKRLAHRSKESLIKRVYHKCKLCRKSLPCETKILSHHLKTKHNISPEEYCRSNNCAFAETEEESFMKTLKLSDRMDNLCVFVCSICDKTFSTSRNFNLHKFAEKHYPNSGQYFKCLISGFSYKCIKCSRLLLCDKGIIHQHMKRSHNVSTKADFPSATVTKYNQFCEAFMKDLPVSARAHEQLTLSRSEIPISEITSAIGNLCTFCCTKCDKNTFASWATLLRHFRIIHKDSCLYKPSTVLTPRYHACLLCAKVVLSDRYILNSHLNNHHKMKMSEYESVFRKHGGKILPTYNYWLKEREKQIRNKVSGKL